MSVGMAGREEEEDEEGGGAKLTVGMEVEGGDRAEVEE